MVYTRQAGSRMKETRPSKPSKPAICQVIIPKTTHSAQNSINSKPNLGTIENPLAQALRANPFDSHPSQKQQITKQWINSQRPVLASNNSKDQSHESTRETGQESRHEKSIGADHLIRSDREQRPIQSDVHRSTRSESTLEYLDERRSTHSSNQDRLPSFLDLSPTRSPITHTGLDAPSSTQFFDQVTRSTQDQSRGAIFGSPDRNNAQEQHSNGGHLNPAQPSVLKKQTSEISPAADGHPPSPTKYHFSFPKLPGGIPLKTFNQIGPSGDLQADRAVVKADDVNKRTLDVNAGVIDSNNTQSIHQAIHGSRPSLTPKVQKDQAHQDSDLSLADLLNIRKGKSRSNPKIHHRRRHNNSRSRRAKSKTPKSVLLSSSSPSSPSSQIHTHQNRKSKKGQKPSWRGVKKSKAPPKNDENLDRDLDRSGDGAGGDDGDRTVIQTPVKTLVVQAGPNEVNLHRPRPRRRPLESHSPSTPHRSRIRGNLERPKLEPRVLIPKPNLSNHPPRPRDRNRDRDHDPWSKEDSKTSERKSKPKRDGGRPLKLRPTTTRRHDSQKRLENQGYEEEGLERASITPPDRRARLKYYQELDRLELEEEEVIEV